MAEQHRGATHARGAEKCVEPRDIAIDVVRAVSERLARAKTRQVGGEETDARQLRHNRPEPVVVAAKAVHEHDGAVGVGRPVLNEVGLHPEHLNRAIAGGDEREGVGVRRGNRHRLQSRQVAVGAQA